MLVIISDLHLGDGTTAESIPASAFYLFAKRLRQDAHFAAMSSTTYHPIDELDVLLMGDILDPIHSTRWLYPGPDSEGPYRINERGEKVFDLRITEPGEKDYIRPWSDPHDPKYAAKLLEVTEAILEYNKEGLQVFRDLSEGLKIDFDPLDENQERSMNSDQKIPLKVRFHYMVGNHDWYYHLEGNAFNQIRQKIIDALGLSNRADCPFPYDLSEDKPKAHSEYPNWKSDVEEGNNDAGRIKELLNEYQVFVRHGDCFDMFNFDPLKGRDHATLGDAFAMEVCNRYPEELKRVEGLNQGFVNRLRHITNIRPALATPLWITGQIRNLSLTNHLDGVRAEDLKDIHDREKKLRGIWDKLADNFLRLDFVRKEDKPFKFDIVDKMQLAIKISKAVSSKQIDSLIYTLQNKASSAANHSFAQYALQEPSFIDNKARYIVYGHTHYHETIPLDYDDIGGNQIYFNSGTWHTYFDLARKNPTEKKFIPYKALTYITFYKDSEHEKERKFETWSGAYA